MFDPDTADLATDDAMTSGGLDWLALPDWVTRCRSEAELERDTVARRLLGQVFNLTAWDN